MIETWLAGKVTGMITLALAIVGVILIFVTAYQTFQIYGLGFPFPIYGRVIIFDGLKPQLDAMQAKLDKSAQDYKDLSGLYSQRTRDMQAAGDKAVADQAAKTTAAEAKLRLEQANNKALALRVKGILDNAKESDAHTLSPAVLQYLDELRSGQRQTPTDH